MLRKAMEDLRGDEVMARDGRIGALDDLYFDEQCWQVRYLLVATGTELRPPGVLISAACACAPALERDRLLVRLSHEQIALGAGAWAGEAAARWLERSRVCSGLELVGFRVEARNGAAGCVADLLVDDQDWSIPYLIMDADSGARERLVPPDWLEGVDLGKRTLHARLTRDELRAAPAL